MPRYLRRLLSPVVLPHWSQDVALLLPRVVCGYLLTSNFGAAKFGLPWSPAENNLGLFEVAFWFPGDVAKFGGAFAMFPGTFAWMGAFSEAVGGLFLVLGLCTRPFALLVLCTMLTAMFLQQMHAGMWNMLPSLGFAWVGLYLLVLGSGRFGIDHLLSRAGPRAA
jgi:putative oxidoreductase